MVASAVKDRCRTDTNTHPKKKKSRDATRRRRGMPGKEGEDGVGQLAGAGKTESRDQAQTHHGGHALLRFPSLDRRSSSSRKEQDPVDATEIKRRAISLGANDVGRIRGRRRSSVMSAATVELAATKRRRPTAPVTTAAASDEESARKRPGRGRGGSRSSSSFYGINTSLPFSPCVTIFILLVVALYSLTASIHSYPPYSWIRAAATVAPAAVPPPLGTPGGTPRDNHDRIVQHRPAFEKAER